MLLSERQQRKIFKLNSAITVHGIKTSNVITKV